MRQSFDKELELLNLDIIKMGSMIEDSIDKAIIVLKKQDAEMAEAAIKYDDAIDEMERIIESKCLKLLLHQQPVARDLRLISTALKIITDMERIGDHAADISEIFLRIGEEQYIKQLEHIPEMGDVAAKMVRLSVDAFVKRDITLAEQVIAMDDQVDALFNELKADLTELMIQDKKNIDQAVDFLLIAKYLERIGDHAENIAEWVIFSVTGEHKNTRIM
ncbi:MAG: phosphate signaling complex protein PhoU [Clostridia bacterium]